MSTIKQICQIHYTVCHDLGDFSVESTPGLGFESGLGGGRIYIVAVGILVCVDKYKYEQK